MRGLFISCSRDERPVAGEVHRALAASGYPVFCNYQREGGEDWWSAVLAAIRGCDVFVALVSDAWVRSAVGQLETAYAHRLGKVILPVFIGSVPSDQLPPGVAGAQWVSFVAGDEASTARLLQAVAVVPASPPLPEPLPDAPAAPSPDQPDAGTGVPAGGGYSSQPPPPSARPRRSRKVRLVVSYVCSLLTMVGVPFVGRVAVSLARSVQNEGDLAGTRALELAEAADKVSSVLKVIGAVTLVGGCISLNAL